MAFGTSRELLSCAAAAFLGVALGTAEARADGGFPRAHDILFEPGDSSHILVRSDIWGFFRSLDGGQTWQYGCSELFGGASKTTERQNVLYLSGGRILVGVSRGIRMTDDYCNWRSNTSVGTQNVADFAVSGTDLYLVSTRNSDGGVGSHLLRSVDNGDTWAEVQSAFPPNFIANSIRVAPSDPTRMYCGGSSIGQAGATVLVSSDSGATWTETRFDPPPASWHIRVRAISPTNPDIAFVWVDNSEKDDRQPDWVWATGNAGGVWTQILAGQEDLPGIALSPDGTELRIAGKADGLMGGAVSDVLASGTSALRKVFDGSIWGLTWRPEALYAGNNNFTARGIPAFTLGKSIDSGATFTPLMNICQLELGSCPAGSDQATLCPAMFEAPGGFKPDFQAPRCSDTPDAGTSKGSDPDCACRQPPGTRSSSGAGALTALSFALLALTRGRRRSPSALR